MTSTCLKCAISISNIILALLGIASAVGALLVKEYLKQSQIAPAGKIPVIQNLTEDLVLADSLLSAIAALGLLLVCITVLGCIASCVESHKAIITFGILLSLTGLILAVLEVLTALQIEVILVNNKASSEEAKTVEALAIAGGAIIAILACFTSCFACCLGKGIKNSEDVNFISMMRLNNVRLPFGDRSTER